MKTAIILHGMPSKEEYFDPESSAQSNQHWLPWLQRQLLLNNILAQNPELPEPFEPHYEAWKSVFEQFKVDTETSLIGHSCGGGFLVRWLSENKVKVGKVALVAPFLDPDHDETPKDMFDFQIDSTLAERTKGVSIFVSEDDDQEIQDSVKQLESTLPNVQIKTFTGQGHFTFEEMKTDRFPELAAWLLD